MQGKRRGAGYKEEKQERGSRSEDRGKGLKTDKKDYLARFALHRMVRRASLESAGTQRKELGLS